jgi:hypothetical protein
MHWSNTQYMNILPWMSIGIFPIMLWSVTWKGLALWHAAKRNEKWWFIGLLVVNTVGILEMCYLLFVVRLFSSVGPTFQSKKSPKKKRAR